MRKFYQFLAIVLIAAAVTIFILPQLLQDRLPVSKYPLAGTIHFPQFSEMPTPTSAATWGETGATVLPLAAQIMAVRNPQGIALDRVQKGYLRPLFGNLVDRVTVVYQAKLLDRWSQNGQETHIGGVDSSAQTYGDRIYIRARSKPRDTNLLVLLAHELTHAQQCDRLGGISKFGERYFQGYYHSGQNYQNNPLEQSARKMEEKFIHQLCRKINCPPRRGRYYVNYKGWGLKVPVNL
jgi:hypothetical protein